MSTTTIRYIGTQDRWPEVAVTGKQSLWFRGQSETRPDAEAASLMATGFFESMTSSARLADRVGGFDLIAPDGSAFSIGEAVTYAPPASAMLTDYALAPVPRALALPNPYPSLPAHVVHPSILCCDPAFNGYRYWLAFTPYPNANAEFENPSVVASNDLVSWVAPRPNPIVPKPPGTGPFNADVYLTLSPDRRTMFMLYCERGVNNENVLKCLHTTDGVNWTQPVALLSGTVGSQAFSSPSVWWNGTGWTLISHNLDAASPHPIQRRVSTSADIYGSWGTATTVTATPPANRTWWHSFMRRLSSGQIVGIAQDNDSVGSPGHLYWFTSFDDGATFQISRPISYQGGLRYHSTFALRGQEMDLILGDALTGVDYVKARIGANASRAQSAGQNAAALAAGTLAGLSLWSDTCVRANSSTVPGTASGGGTYVVSSGTWGISSNQLYAVTSGRLLADVGNRNHRVVVQFSGLTTGVQQWMIGRAVDGSNYWRLGIQSPAAAGPQMLELQNITAGNVAQTIQFIGRCVTGDYLGLEFVDTTLRVLLNGVPIYEMQTAAHAAGQSIGLQSNDGASSRYRNLVAFAA